MRLSIIKIIERDIFRFEIHTPLCSDVVMWVRRGSFAAFVNGESPEAIVRFELATRSESGLTAKHFKIMPCCGSKWRVLDVLKGTGHVLSRGGDNPVQYDLEIYENEIRGWIRPFFGEEKERFTLEMQNGTSLEFCFNDNLGNVAANGGIIPAL